MPVRCGKFSTGLAEVNGKKIADNLNIVYNGKTIWAVARLVFFVALKSILTVMQSFFLVVDYRIVLL